jgi:predicted kinase
MTVEARVFFVGGASASGKSTATKRMAVEHAVPCIELDALRNAMARAFVDKALLIKAMNGMTKALLRELIAGGADVIVEGGWMQPNDAEELVREFGHRFRPVFCGYPDDSPSERLEKIRTHEGTKHWLNSRADAEQFLEGQISGSAYYENEAHSRGLDFINFTDPAGGCKRLEQVYRDWRAASR